MVRSTCASRWRLRALALVSTLDMAVATAAAADATPQVGSFKATGAIKFAFTVTKGRCEGQPSNLSNPNAKPGKVKVGYCFSSASSPVVKLSCFSGDTAAIQELSGLRLSSSGVLHVRAYSYYGGNIVAGFTELDLKVSGARARGFVRVKWIDASGSPICETTKLAFTATRR
jgi:hypothetical protein